MSRFGLPVVNENAEPHCLTTGCIICMKFACTTTPVCCQWWGRPSIQWGEHDPTNYMPLFNLKVKKLSIRSPLQSTTSTLYMRMTNCQLHESTNHMLSHRMKKNKVSISFRLALTTTTFHSNRKHQHVLCLTPYWLLQLQATIVDKVTAVIGDRDSLHEK